MLQQKNCSLVVLLSCPVNWCSTFIILYGGRGTVSQQQPNGVSVVTPCTPVKSCLTLTISFINVCSSLQQLMYDVSLVERCCTLECSQTIPIKTIKHSFIQQAKNLSDVTISRCMSEAFDELWIDFYGRNKRSNKTVSFVRNSCPSFTLFNHLISFKQWWRWKPNRFPCK